MTRRRTAPARESACSGTARTPRWQQRAREQKTTSFAHLVGRFAVGRAVDDEYFRRPFARRGEPMHHIRREEARVARLHFATLAVELDGRAALQQIADLLDTGVGMQRRARALLDHAEQHFDVLR